MRRERKWDPRIFSPGETRCDCECEPDSSGWLPLPGTAALSLPFPAWPPRPRGAAVRAADTHSVVKANPGSLSLQEPSAVEAQEPHPSDVTPDT